MQQLAKTTGGIFATTFPAITYFADIMPVLQFLGLIVSIAVGVTIIRMNVTKTNLYEKQLEHEKRVDKRKQRKSDDDE